MNSEQPALKGRRHRLPRLPWFWQVLTLLLLVCVAVGGLISFKTFTRADAASCGTTNVALQRPTTVSSMENDSFSANKAVDGKANTRWSSAFSDPQWIQVDLGKVQTICSIGLDWEAAYGTAYQIQTSNDAKTWTTVYSTTNGTGNAEKLTVSGSGRYVRLYGTKRGTPYGYSLFEFQVYTTASSSDALISQGRPATSSSIQNNSECEDCNASKAVDGKPDTRWSTAFSDPQWIQIDLGDDALIHTVVLDWEAAYGKAYQIQTSNDAKTWTAIYSTTQGNGGTETLTVSGSGRYIRLYGTQRGTPYGYSLFEFQVYGTSSTSGTPGGDSTPTPTVTSTPPPVEGWNMIWNDEFNSANGTKPDASKWTPAVGGEGWGNQELEYYTNNDNAQQDGNGNLVIEARKENPANYQCWYGTCQYTSARLITLHKFEFTHGRVEARIKIPYGQGIWPSIWMMGNDIDTVGWPNNGEIDIFENIGREPGTIHGTVHGPGYSGANGIGGAYTLPGGARVSDDYHLFAVEWTTNQIDFFLDGTKYFTVTRATVEQHGKWVYDHPFYLLLNVAVGGTWPGNPDGSSTYPQKMSVDYVRVYQPK